MGLRGKLEGKALKGKINKLVELRGYSAYEVAALNGFEGTAEEWLSSLEGKPGKDGTDGEPGVNGITPHIGNNGNWFIGETDTGMPSRGEDGQDGHDGYTPVKVTVTQQSDGTYTAEDWTAAKILDAHNTGHTVYCQWGNRVLALLVAAKPFCAFGCVHSENVYTVTITAATVTVTTTPLTSGGSGSGEDGITPHIGANGNWFIGETDTGMPSRGEAGPTGAQGEKGEPGPQGIQGEQGPKGDPGSAGADGAKGEKGDKGDTGPQGEKGDAFTYSDFTAEQLASLKGEKGDKGDTGAQGPKGDTGAAGEKGEQGIQGEPGAKGDKGDKGDTGSQGPAGTAGKDGSNGKDGTSVTIKSVSESTADGGGNVVTFSDGKTLTVKNGSKGSKGDKGDKGDTGPKGDTGADGPQGPTGATGADGKTPVKGTDYWTQADQEAIVQQVITALGTPVFGRVDEGNNIILTGELIDGTYTLKYEDAEGNVIEIGTLTQGGTSYTNLANPNSTDWLTNQRLNSSGAVVDTTPAITTNYIPLKLNDYVRIRGLNIWHQGTSDGNATTWFYDENKNRVASTAPVTAPSYYPKDNDGNGHAFNVSNSSTHKLTVLEGYSASDIRYARFVGKLYDGFTADDVIITVNQEITE